MPKKILFVEPELRTDKLGVLYLSAVLKAAGHHVQLAMGAGGPPESFLHHEDYDFLMFSVTTGSHRWATKAIQRLKADYSFTAVVGGPHYTFFPEDGMADPNVDYVVRGPGENVIVDLVENPPANRQIMGTVPDIRALPRPDRELLYQYPRFGNARMKRFIACRDCPNACTYCFNHIYHRIFKDQRKQFYQVPTPRQMVDEIKWVKERWGLELAYFNDDDFARDKDWLTEFCQLFKSEVGIEFCGSVRADSLTREIVQMIADAGCSFMNIALESSVKSTQKLLRRGRVNNHDITNACKWFWEAGVKVRLQNMIGLPVDDPIGDAFKTYAFNLRCRPTDSWAAVFQPYRNTDAWKLCIEKGLLGEDTEAKTFTDGTVLRFDPNTRMQIDNIAKWWYHAVKWKLSRHAFEDLSSLLLVDAQKDVIQRARWEEAAEVLYGL